MCLSVRLCVSVSQGAQGASISGAHILPLAVPLSTPVSQMELDKNVLLQGILSGFSQVSCKLACMLSHMQLSACSCALTPFWPDCVAVRARCLRQVQPMMIAWMFM
jgi:hypothetical protein